MSGGAGKRPSTTPEDARRWTSELYALKVEDVAELDGHLDRNFRLSTADGEFVLKVSDGRIPLAELEARTSLLERIAADPGLRSLGVRTPTPKKNRDGKLLASRTDGDGRECRIRLLDFLPGQLLGKVKPHSPELLGSAGAALGTLDRALEGIDPEPLGSAGGDWDLSRAGEVLRRHGNDVEEGPRRRLIADVLEAFENRVEERLPSLRHGMIHGDGNEYNLLVGPGEAGKIGGMRVSGIIDFGDVVESALVHEPAIAAAYAALDKEDPLRAASHVVAGYHREHPLEENEIALLFPLVRARLAVSVTLGAYHRRLEPENAYLSVSEAGAWGALKRLDAIDEDFAHAFFRVACGLPADGNGKRVRRFLEKTRAGKGFAPLVDGDSASAPVLDLSVGSPLAADLRDGDPTDPAPLIRRVEELLAREGADMAVGRYDEPRLLYAAEQFAPVPGLEHPERRTIHLGIDLFQPAGSPVYAPLDGTVHGAADNAFPLDYGPTVILRHEIVDPGEGGDEPLVFYTLYGHLDRASLDRKTVGATVRRGELLGRMGDVEVNGGWAPHLHFQILLQTFGHRENFPGVAPPTDRRLWTEISPDPNPIVGVPEERFPPAPWSAGRILESRRRHLGRNLSLSYRSPLHIVAGRGTYLYDAEGRAYLDAVNNVPHVGHCHPKVVAAGREQMGVLNTNTRYLNGELASYVERLAATFPDPLDVCILCCTGSEANDLALRMARAFTRSRSGDDRPGNVIVVDGAYHGHTSRLIGLSPYKFDGPGGRGAPPETRVVPLPCGFRGPHKHDDPDPPGHRYAAAVAHACAEATAAGHGVTAFLSESILGCGGQVVLPPGYLQAAYAHARKAGGVCIADEVQVGFGRVGTHFWAFETQGVVPDIVTLGKPMGNGHPLAAVITTAEIADAFADGMEYFNTFGGNPVSCRIGSAVLDVIAEEGLQENARRTGDHLLARLRALADEYPLIGEVRGLGLFVGVELVRDRETLEPASAEASHIAERLRDHGILISTDGPLHNVLKIKPPLVFGEREAEHLAAVLGRILGEDFT